MMAIKYINKSIKNQIRKIYISKLTNKLTNKMQLEWPGWNSSMPMPNSNGCIHAAPNDIEYVWKVLVAIGVQVRNNTDGKLPYPYKPQVNVM